MTYFDYNATTPLDPVARAAWLTACDEQWYNPSSPYRNAARVHELLEDCRARLAALLGCAPELVVFNSGATEGNYSLLDYFQRTLGPDTLVGVSAIEHPCVYASARTLLGARCHVFPVSPLGIVDLDAITEVLSRNRFGLVSVMAANNETGVLQPWQEVVSLCRDKGVPVHVDAAQWLGKEPLDGIDAVDFVTGCAHKFGGPKGVGFLKLSASYTGYRAALGGAQEHDHRAGTENYPGVVAMLAALEARITQLTDERIRQQRGKAGFEQHVIRRIQGVDTVGGDAQRLANTSLLLLPAHLNTRWVLQLEKQGFQVSTGSACATGKAGPSHVLAAMGISADAAHRSIRVSGGWTTSEADWEALARAMVNVWQRLEDEKGNSQVIQV